MMLCPVKSKTNQKHNFLWTKELINRAILNLILALKQKFVNRCLRYYSSIKAQGHKEHLLETWLTMDWRPSRMYPVLYLVWAVIGSSFSLTRNG